MKNYRKSMENMTITLIDQFCELVNSHVKSIVPVLHETNRRVGPSPPHGWSLGDFESYRRLSPKFHVDVPLCDFKGDDDIS